MKSKIINTFLMVSLLILGLTQFKIAFFEQSSFSGPRKSIKLWQYQVNPQPLTQAANNAYLYQGDSEKALHLLQKALTNDPLYIPAWIALSELKVYQGNKKEALAILAYIDSLMIEVGCWHWEKAMLAYQLGDTEMVARDLSYIIGKLPGQRGKALDLAFSLWPDPETLRGKIGDKNCFYLFRYALHPDRLDLAIAFWPLVRQNPELKRNEKLRFIELLRRRGDIRRARTIWYREIDSKYLLFNGDFSKPPLHTAFGWRIGKIAGTAWELLAPEEEKKTAFHLHFTGKENVNYHHLTQYVALRPGNYTLAGVVRCQNLSTDQRPYLEVVGIGSKTPRAKTPMFSELQSGRPFTLKFSVPSDCEQVYVRLRRNKSYYIDNLIAGDLWLRQLKITADEMNDD